MNCCKRLKYRIRGFFPADFPCSSVLKNDNTFMIMNASLSDQPGTHWLLFAQAGGQIFFADLIDKRFSDYTLMYKNKRPTIHELNQLLMIKQIQSANSVLCGLNCNYVAHIINKLKFPISFKFIDHDLIRFAKHMLF